MVNSEFSYILYDFKNPNSEIDYWERVNMYLHKNNKYLNWGIMSR